MWYVLLCLYSKMTSIFFQRWIGRSWSISRCYAAATTRTALPGWDPCRPWKSCPNSPVRASKACARSSKACKSGTSWWCQSYLKKDLRWYKNTAALMILIHGHLTYFQGLVGRRFSGYWLPSRKQGEGQTPEVGTETKLVKQNDCFCESTIQNSVFPEELQQVLHQLG